MSASLLEPIVQGNEVRLGVEFFNEQEELTDGTVLCKIIDPRQNQTTLAVLHDATGIYHSLVIAGSGGLWRCRFESTGAVIAAVEGTFEVANSSFV